MGILLNRKILFNSLICFYLSDLDLPCSSADSRDPSAPSLHLHPSFFLFPPPSTPPSVCRWPPSPPLPLPFSIVYFSLHPLSHSALNKTDEKNNQFFLASRTDSHLISNLLDPAIPSFCSVQLCGIFVCLCARVRPASE